MPRWAFASPKNAILTSSSKASRGISPRRVRTFRSSKGLMSNPEVVQRVQKVFDAVFLTPVVVTRELSANDVDEWDSMLQVSLVVAIESEFRINFRVGEVEATRNVGEFMDIIEAKLRETKAR